MSDYVTFTISRNVYDNFLRAYMELKKAETQQAKVSRRPSDPPLTPAQRIEYDRSTDALDTAEEMMAIETEEFIEELVKTVDAKPH